MKTWPSPRISNTWTLSHLKPHSNLYPMRFQRDTIYEQRTRQRVVVNGILASNLDTLGPDDLTICQRNSSWIWLYTTTWAGFVLFWTVVWGLTSAPPQPPPALGNHWCELEGTGPVVCWNWLVQAYGTWLLHFQKFCKPLLKVKLCKFTIK